MGRWSSLETQLLREVRHRLHRQLTQRPQFPEVVGDRRIVRFLRGWNHDVNKTCEVLEKFLQWRLEAGVDEIRQQIVVESVNSLSKFPHASAAQMYLKCVLSDGLLGLDTTAAPIVFEQAAYTADMWDGSRPVSVDAMERHFIHRLELTSLLLEQLSARREEQRLRELGRSTVDAAAEARELAESEAVPLDMGPGDAAPAAATATADSAPFGEVVTAVLVRDMSLNCDAAWAHDNTQQLLSRLASVASSYYPHTISGCVMVNAPPTPEDGRSNPPSTSDPLLRSYCSAPVSLMEGAVGLRAGAGGIVTADGSVCRELGSAVHALNSPENLPNFMMTPAGVRGSLDTGERNLQPVSLDYWLQNRRRDVDTARVVRQAKQVSYGEGGEVLDCLFCRITRREEPGSIVFEDSCFVAFKNIRPVAPCHLLVVPRTHVRNLDALRGSDENTPEDSPHHFSQDGRRGGALLRELRVAGGAAFEAWLRAEGREKLGISGTLTAADEASLGLQFCFHVPPYNSVDHLHLHVIAGPRKSWLGSLIYNSDYTFWCRSFDDTLREFPAAEEGEGAN